MHVPDWRPPAPRLSSSWGKWKWLADSGRCRSPCERPARLSELPHPEEESPEDHERRERAPPGLQKVAEKEKNNLIEIWLFGGIWLNNAHPRAEGGKWKWHRPPRKIFKKLFINFLFLKMPSPGILCHPLDFQQSLILTTILSMVLIKLDFIT